MGVLITKESVRQRHAANCSRAWADTSEGCGTEGCTAALRPVVMLARNLRKHPRGHAPNPYADRNKAKCFFGRLTEARGFATRYEKTATAC